MGAQDSDADHAANVADQVDLSQSVVTCSADADTRDDALRSSPSGVRMRCQGIRGRSSSFAGNRPTRPDVTCVVYGAARA
eukprot:3928718-Pyramimonas_sp.AAC.1